MNKSVGIVILDFNQSKLTERCLAALAKNTLRPNVIVIVENGDERCKLSVSDWGDDTSIVVLSPGRNLGCAGGRNMGLSYLARNTKVETFVILDNDTIASTYFIERLAAHPVRPLDVLAPLIYHSSTNEIWSSGGTLDADGNIQQLTVAPALREQAVDWAPGACLIMKRDAWRRVGEFDAWIHFYYEDVEWCHRVRMAGGRIIVCSDLCLHHEASQSLGGEWSSERVRLWVRNGILFRLISMEITARAMRKWLWGEVLQLWRDTSRCHLGWSFARVVGLIDGMTEVARRSYQNRWRRHKGVPAAESTAIIDLTKSSQSGGVPSPPVT
jgi:GT2 family glycosyltransferase